MFESVLYESGRPVLLAPPRWDGAKFDTVVVAWDGSREVTRAVADAWPLLTAAGRRRAAAELLRRHRGR